MDFLGKLNLQNCFEFGFPLVLLGLKAAERETGSEIPAETRYPPDER